MNLLSNRQSSSVIFLVILLPALMMLIHPYAFASRCRDCPDLTPYEAYGGAKAVFVGRAISGEEIKWDDRNKGTVSWPDGRPAAKADVYLSPLTQPGLGAGKFVRRESSKK